MASSTSGDGVGWVSVDSYHDYRPDLVAQLYNELLAPSFLDPAGRLDAAQHGRLCGQALLRVQCVWTRHVSLGARR